RELANLGAVETVGLFKEFFCKRAPEKVYLYRAFAKRPYTTQLKDNLIIRLTNFAKARSTRGY
ncbi:MAG: hypothetical protein ACFNUV_07655, partial [Capnocytophaga endodontalis]